MPTLLPFTLPKSRTPTRPVRVNFVIDRLSRAGTETQLLALLRHLDRSRVEPSLVLLDGTDAESQALLPDGPTLCLGVQSLRRDGWHAAKLLRQFWRSQRVQIVQTYFLDSTYFAVPLARLCGVRRIIRVRNNVGYWLTPKHRFLGRLMGRMAHATLTNSTDGATAIHTSEALPTRRIRVIANGVDVDRFPSTAAPFTRGAPRFGAVANLRPVKNIDGLIRVAQRVLAQHPTATFAVAGDGPERAALTAQIAAAGLHGRFVLRGSVQDIPGFLAQLDVVVLPSHSESMSNALLEAMAAGRAIVATDVGANASLLQQGAAGTLVPPRDDTALATALLQYIAAPELARRHATAARQHVEAEYSRMQMVRRFEAFYEGLR